MAIRKFGMFKQLCLLKFNEVDLDKIKGSASNFKLKPLSDNKDSDVGFVPFHEKMDDQFTLKVGDQGFYFLLGYHVRKFLPERIKDEKNKLKKKAIEEFKKANNTETLTNEQRSSIDKTAENQAKKNLRPKTDYKTSYVKIFVSTKLKEVHLEAKFSKDADGTSSDEGDAVKVDVLKECKKYLKLIGLDELTAGLEYELSISAPLTGIVRNTEEIQKLDVEKLIVGKQSQMVNESGEKVKFTNHELHNRPDEVDAQIEASKEVTSLEFILENIDVGFVVSDNLHVSSIRNISKKDALAEPENQDDTSDAKGGDSSEKGEGVTLSELVSELLESLEINYEIIRTCRSLVEM